MIKVSVVSKNEIWKYIIKFGIIVVIFFILLKVYKYSKENFTQTQVTTDQCISYITEEIAAFSNSNDTKNVFNVNPQSIIESELRMSKSVTSRSYDSVTTTADQEADVESETSEETTNDIGEELSEVSTDVTTEVVASSYKETYTNEIDGVKIKNETDYDLSSMNLTTDITVNNENILIFHTHTCESYTQTEENQYEASGNYRTTDLNYSVAQVGNVLQTYLTSYGYNVIHDTTYHDYPTYSGSYGRSLTTVSNLLLQNPNTDVVIDLHRDAVGDDSYAPKVKIGDEYVAQIMFVIGTNGSGLSHDNWQQNLEFAIKVQQKANELYPGLFKPILLRNARYNQHLSSAATIIEIGATGNTLEECEASAKYLAKILSEVME